MNRMFIAAITALILAMGFTSAAAGPVDDAVAAANRGDNATALRLLRPLAERGDAAAQYCLGLMYANGKGVSRDYAAAVTWYRKAADQDYDHAQVLLGAMYATGKGVPKSDLQAFRWYRKAADQGNARAQAMVGTAYEGGFGVPQDYAEAVRWYRQGADQGEAGAQSSLGQMYAQGLGTPQNYAEASKWLRRAAEQGEASAQFRLGALYEKGLGVARENSAAAAWYRRAADQDFAPAQVNLGIMYGLGAGVPQSFVLAYVWFSLAAAHSTESDIKSRNEATKGRDTIAPAMTRWELAEAQKRAAEWRPKLASARPLFAAKRPESEASSGTAFFVTPDGKALTNAHVVRGCREITVITEGQSHPAKVLARDLGNDLALLATDLHPALSANWRLQIRQGEDVVVYGFPLTGALASGGNVTTGIVTALAGRADDSRFLQVSAPVQPGNSGGPLFDRSGTVVGIIVSKLDALSIASATGDIPQNVNFAIKASVAAAFLDAQRVEHAERTGEGAFSTPDIADRAKSFTVRVLCR
jgi:uncharacterized protein